MSSFGSMNGRLDHFCSGCSSYRAVGKDTFGSSWRDSIGGYDNGRGPIVLYSGNSICRGDGAGSCDRI